MNSRECVYRTLEFSRPARIPRQLWLLPWAGLYYKDELAQIQRDFPDDILHVPGFHRQIPQTHGQAYKIGTFVDEWGCAFEAKEEGVIGEVCDPQIKTWDDREKLRLPEEVLSIDIDKVNDFCRSTDKFTLSGCCPRPFERIQFLRGTENLMMDLAYGEESFFELLNTIHQFNLKELEMWAKTEVDALSFMDDWGAQHALLISPNQWRQVFKPLYKDYIDLAHACGKKIFMHSDGYILDILPDLVELGLDAINSQIFCMGVEELGRRFKGKIAFWGEMDRQSLLPNGTQDQIGQAVEQVYRALYQEGGVIAQLEFGPGANPANVYKAFETWETLSSRIAASKTVGSKI